MFNVELGVVDIKDGIAGLASERHDVGQECFQGHQNLPAIKSDRLSYSAMHQLSNRHVDWDAVDTLLLDMDGTLLDLNFDTFFWLEVIPNAYADAQGRPLPEVLGGLRATFERHRGTLNWYAIDFWTRELGLDVMALQRSHAERITYLDGRAGVPGRGAQGRQAVHPGDECRSQNAATQA